MRVGHRRLSYIAFRMNRRPTKEGSEQLDLSSTKTRRRYPDETHRSSGRIRDLAIFTFYSDIKKKKTKVTYIKELNYILINEKHVKQKIMKLIENKVKQFISFGSIRVTALAFKKIFNTFTIS